MGSDTRTGSIPVAGSIVCGCKLRVYLSLQPLSLFYTFGTNQYNFGTSPRTSAFRSLIDKVNAQVTLDSVKLHQVGAEMQETLIYSI